MGYTLTDLFKDVWKDLINSELGIWIIILGSLFALMIIIKIIAKITEWYYLLDSKITHHEALRIMRQREKEKEVKFEWEYDPDIFEKENENE